MTRIVAVVILLCGIGSPAIAEPVPQPQLRYLGVAGFLLQWRDEAVLFDPFFSRPSAMHMFWMTPDITAIRKGMRGIDHVTMVLVGHGHYDHLLDVAEVVRSHVPGATVYGSTSVLNTLRAELAANQYSIVDVQQQMAKEKEPWFVSTRGQIRAMPIISMHAPNIFTPYMDGDQPPGATSLPTSLFGWKQGQVLAWLVDLLDATDKVVYRIHFQDSASDAPFGFPPALGDGKRVDVQILPVASWDKAHDYPDALLNRNQPRLIVLAHWERFVGGKAKDAKPMWFSGEDEFVAKVRANANGAPIIRPEAPNNIPLPPIEVK